VARADLLLVILHACVSDQGGMSGWNPTPWIQAVITRKHKFVSVRYIQTSNKQNWARKYVHSEMISAVTEKNCSADFLVWNLSLQKTMDKSGGKSCCDQQPTDIHHLITVMTIWSNAFPKLWLPCNLELRENVERVKQRPVLYK
jgi:hypothetical protein